MKKFLKTTLIVLASIYILICAGLYFFQEKIIFHPTKLNADYKFNFSVPFEEMKIKTKDNVTLDGILFKADSSKGLIFYLHGNGGALDTWGEIAKVYTNMHYDIFMLDYRGYGKSEGSYSNDEQLFSDVQSAYDNLKTKYAENKIVVLGYSLGTGLAAKLCTTNNPKLLILQAPYYNTVDMMRDEYPFIPTFLLKYKFETSKYLPLCQMPIVIFHGDADEMIPYKNSLQLKKLFKVGDRLITLKGQGHNGMSANLEYVLCLQVILDDHQFNKQ